MKKGFISKYRFWAGVVILTAVSVILSCLLYSYAQKWLPSLGIDSDNSLYVNYIYNRLNKDVNRFNSADPSDNQRDTIVIIQTDGIVGSDARKNMANLISSICESEPKCLGIDIRFKYSMDSISDALLIKSIYDNRNKIVVAQTVHQNEIVPSILSLDSVSYGMSRLSKVARYDTCLMHKNENHPSFTYQIYKKVKNERLSDIDFNVFKVNYTSRYFTVITAEQFLDSDEESRKEDVGNKVVLMGDLESPLDFHYVPFLIEGQNGLPGVRLHAYALNSLLNPQDSYESMPLWLTIIFCVILSFFFSSIFLFLNNPVNFKIKNINKYKWLYLFIKPLITFFIANIIIFVVCYCFITKPFFVIPDIVLFMIVVLLINTFSDLISYFLFELK